METLEQDTLTLKALEQALTKNQKWLLETVQTIQNENVSNYPILVAYPTITSIAIGLPVLETERYSFNATTLEELAMKKVFDLEKINSFRKVYKEKAKHFCVFLIDAPAPQFIFVPYHHE